MLTQASDSRLCPKQLDDFWRTGSDFNTQLLRTQLGMCCREPHRCRFFFRSNPDSARSADQRKGVVANNFRGPFQVQLDGVVRKRPDSAKFVGYAQNNAGGISAIRVETSFFVTPCKSGGPADSLLEPMVPHPRRTDEIGILSQRSDS
jgi:hypothetical protein